MMLRGVVAALAAAVGLAGCQTTAATPDQVAQAKAALPVNYRQMIVERAKQEFFDPYSLRDVTMAQPMPGTSMMGAVVTVCIKANAKNRMGGYTGIKETGYVFRDGRISTIAAGDHGYIACQAATGYEPFPELDSAARSPQPAPQPRR